MTHDLPFVHETPFCEHASHARLPGAVSIHVEFSLRTERCAGGKGRYLTFGNASRPKVSAKSGPGGPPQTHGYALAKYKLPIHVSSAKDGDLRARWIWAITPPQMGLMGHWIHTLPRRVGHSAILDTAMDFTLKSLQYFAIRDQANRRAVYETKGKSIQQLQGALRTISKGAPGGDGLLCILLHYWAETFLDINTCDYTHHMNALAHLLAKSSCAQTLPESATEIARILCLDVTDGALQRGIDSRLEGFFEFADGALATMTDASTAINQLISQLPRLSRLVRTAAAEPADQQRIEAARELAHSLWHSSALPLIEKRVQEGILPRGPAFKSVSPRDTAFLSFTSLNAFVIAMDFWYFQNVTCGLLDHLARLCTIEVDLDDVHDRDVRAASNIADSSDWVYAQNQFPPLAMLRYVGPLQISWGAWERLDQRAVDPNSRAHARRMRAQILRMSEGLLAAWRLAPRIMEGLDGLCEAFAGGELSKCFSAPFVRPIDDLHALMLNGVAQQLRETTMC